MSRKSDIEKLSNNPINTPDTFKLLIWYDGNNYLYDRYENKKNKTKDIKDKKEKIK
jgi:hypothetical protein